MCAFKIDTKEQKKGMRGGERTDGRKNKLEKLKCSHIQSLSALLSHYNTHPTVMGIPVFLAGLLLVKPIS